MALDVGHGQLHERIRAHPKVSVVERANIRHVTMSQLEVEPFEMIVVDVSFISLRTIAQVIAVELARTGTELVTLIKPQFEAGRAEVSKGKGVVRDPTVWREAISGVVSAMADARAATMGLMVSPVVGAQGNVEFLAHLHPHEAEGTIASANSLLDIDAVVVEAEALAGKRSSGDPAGERSSE